jgi:hypothetical protein
MGRNRGDVIKVLAGQLPDTCVNPNVVKRR